MYVPGSLGRSGREDEGRPSRREDPTNPGGGGVTLVGVGSPEDEDISERLGTTVGSFGDLIPVFST